MPWTTDDLVSAVKTKVQAPSGGFQVTDQQILDTAWDETIKRIVPPVRAVREDYWTTTTDVDITANLDYVRIPPRAAQSTIVDAWCVLTDGSIKPLARMPVAHRFGVYGTPQTGPEPVWYVLQGDKVIMYPTPTNSGMSLRFMYDRRPSKYVPVASCGLISAIGATTLTTSGGTWSATEIVDVVQADSPFDVLLQSQSSTQATGTFTFAAGILTNKGIVVGDYVADAGYTCVVPLPDALHPALCDFTSSAVMNAIGDYARAQTLQAEIQTYYEALINTFAIRVSNDPPRVFNRQSPLRQYGRAGWWGQGT